MEQVIDHIIIGGEATPRLVTLFPYIHGVISVRTGKTIPDGESIISLTYDTLLTTPEKLLLAAIASALVYKNVDVVVFGRDISTIITDDTDEELRKRIKTRPLAEFSFDQSVAPLPFPIYAILATPNEAMPEEATEEGAQKMLRDTKLALLNLLEDGRDAEEKIREQTERLESALAQASALADARANFISTASHQLRTPLTSIRWFSEMLLSGDTGEITGETHDYVRQIDQGLERIINIVNFLLRSARVESNRVAIDPRPVDIRGALEELIINLSDKLKGKEQTITVNCPVGIIVPLDIQFFREALLNIVTNAHLYSPEKGEIRIDVTLKSENVLIEVTNPGTGIKETDRARVFEKFFRSADAIIASPDGSGLGLAYVREIVHQWDGEITFTSTEGRETTFRITIPRKGMTARHGEVKLIE